MEGSVKESHTEGECWFGKQRLGVALTWLWRFKRVSVVNWFGLCRNFVKPFLGVGALGNSSYFMHRRRGRCFGWWFIPAAVTPHCVVFKCTRRGEKRSAIEFRRLLLMLRWKVLSVVVRSRPVFLLLSSSNCPIARLKTMLQVNWIRKLYFTWRNHQL